jgi:hypothetical protein
MNELRHASLVALAVALTLTMLVDMADARGGSRGKGARGRMPATAATRPMSAATPAAAGTTATKASPTALAIANSVILPSTLPPAPTPAPVSAIGAPAAQVTTIAPLSPPVTTTVLTAGGTARTASADPSSTSPTEAAPSIAGGGGKTLQDCMGFWELATHMTKAEWKGACLRSQNRLEKLNLDVIGLGQSKSRP